MYSVSSFLVRRHRLVKLCDVHTNIYENIYKNRSLSLTTWDTNRSFNDRRSESIFTASIFGGYYIFSRYHYHAVTVVLHSSFCPRYSQDTQDHWLVMPSLSKIIDQSTVSPAIQNSNFFQKNFSLLFPYFRTFLTIYTFIAFHSFYQIFLTTLFSISPNFIWGMFFRTHLLKPTVFYFLLQL